MQVGELAHPSGEGCPNSRKTAPPGPVNLFLYPADIRGWASIWEDRDGAKRFFDGAIDELKNTSTVLALLRGRSNGVLRRMARRGYSEENLAQVPGYIQAKAQWYAKRSVFPLLVHNADHAISEIDRLKLVVKNVVIETHGEQGEGFYLGTKVAANFYTCTSLTNYVMMSPRYSALQKLGARMSGKLVLMGCELGRNGDLLKQVADASRKNVLASMGWVSDWPGMFNDPNTRRPTASSQQIQELSDTLAAVLVKNFRGTIRDLLIERELIKVAFDLFISDSELQAWVSGEVETILAGFFGGDSQVSPSGCADALVDVYYCPEYARHGITKEMMEYKHSVVGTWIEATLGPKDPKYGMDSVLLSVGDRRLKSHLHFHFDADGNPHTEGPAFDSTNFGKAYRKLIELAQGIQRSTLKH